MGYYIQEQQMKLVMICCKQFKGKYCVENIWYEYEEIVLLYDIYEKIICIISVNVVNMVKVFDFVLFGFEEE